MMITTRRMGRSLAAGAIAMTMLVGGLASAGAAPVAQPMEQPPVGINTVAAGDASDWLKTQLKPTAGTGNHFEAKRLDGTVGPDAGVTADGVFAFDATGDNAERDRLAAWLNTPATGGAFVQTTTTTNGTTVTITNPGAAAKLIMVALTAKKADGSAYDPNNFAGLHLVDLLEAGQAADGTFNDQGRYAYPGTFSQSLAILALTKAKPASATLPKGVTALRAAACPDKTYSWGLGASKCAANDQTDPDSTGLSLQALAFYQKTHPTDPNNAVITTDMQSGATALAGKRRAQDETPENAQLGQAWVNTCQEGDWVKKYFSANSTAMATVGIQAAAAPADTASRQARIDGILWLARVMYVNSVGTGMPACHQSGPGDVRATVQGVPGLAEKTFETIMA